MSLALGIYVGQKDVSAILADETGLVVSRNQTSIEDEQAEKELPPGYVERDAELLWQTVIKCLQVLVASPDVKQQDIIALGVSSASGTVVPVDKNGEALYSAIMGEDGRALKEAKLANEKGEKLVQKQGCQFDEFSSLAKIIWLRKEKPELYGKTRKFIDVPDFITGKLSGEFFVTDSSNALKSGYDLIDLKWPSFLRELELLQESLPRVVKPGEPIGSVLPSMANQIGISHHTKVIAGTTDEISLLASSGVTSAGQWNSHLGDRLSVRGLSPKLIKDKLSRIYSNLHPEGIWIPQGISHVGQESIKERFQEKDLSDMDRHIQPSNLIVYPLNHQGEKFPFVNPDAQGFIIGKALNEYDLYSGYLEGIGYVEKWIFELLVELGFEVGEQIFVTGCVGTQWLQIRANILEKVLASAKYGSPEMGTAILSASKIIFSSLSEATKSMVRIENQIEPRSPQSYQSKYRKFRQACRAIGYE